MRKRVTKAVLALLAMMTAVFITAASASAGDNNWGQASKFTFYAATTEGACGDWNSPSVYDYEAYRSGPDQITVMWQVPVHGVMKIRLWNSYGPVSALRSFDSDHLTAPKVWYAHFSPFPNNESVHLTWYPNTGAPCYATYVF